MKKLPPVPKFVHTVLGDVPVAQVDVIKTTTGEDVEAMGYVDCSARKIQIRKDLSPVAAHHIVRHEWMHVVLFDAGVSLDEKTEETVCDVVATALVAQLLSKVTGRSESTK